MNRRRFLNSGVSLGLAGLSASGLAAVHHAPALNDGPLRLNANENALGLSPQARAAASAALAEGHRYSFAESARLRDQLAELEGISAANIVLGNGSSELLRLAVSLLTPGDGLVITADPTYEAVAAHASVRGLQTIKVPLAADYSHDLAAMQAAAAGHESSVLVYICNPNNPTATITPTGELRRWIESASDRILFLVDEAYHHYAENPAYESLASEAARRSNLLVSRTFSKVYAMAGLRIGFLVGAPESIERVARLTRLNTSNVALAAAAASVEDPGFVEKSVRLNRESRTILCETLRALEVSFLPSETNFVMFEVPGSLADFRNRMEARQAYVGRSFPPMTGHCRVSLGFPAQMVTFCALLREFREKRWI